MGTSNSGIFKDICFWDIFIWDLSGVSSEEVLNLSKIEAVSKFSFISSSSDARVDGLCGIILEDPTIKIEKERVNYWGRHSTSDLPATPTPLAPSFYHGTCAPCSSTQLPAVPFRSRPPLQPHLSYTPVPYEAYESVHPGPSHTPDTVYDPYLHALTIRPRIPYRSAAQESILEFSGQPRQIGVNTHAYSHADFGVSSSKPYIGRPVDRGEVDEGGDDGGDGGDDGEDEGEDAGDEEQPVPVAPVAHTSVSDGRPRYGKGKGLTRSFMSMMSKISGSRNKRPDVAREVPAPTQRRKKIKSSEWKQTGPADGGPVDPELIPSYGGHTLGPIWLDRCISLS
ncbi:hypothetical protein M9H77_16519 [Catharanthus roseus]|uniref:Uncharacterized protein n=1 Tax=Catharanthus roseus TaxID=4058 RepID=A0ACC0B211_CATRO|nr:hypothetical protein M9H77_16519 [Catharanthus roseus]